MVTVKINRKWMLLSGILFFIAECSAKNHIVFDYSIFESSGITMPYRIATLNESYSDHKPALVIYLHGGSSKGADNETQMLESGIDSIANYLADKNIQAILLVPQCPADKSWGGPMLGVLKSLIEQYKENTADDSRIYILGGSMGGTGAWDMLSAYPGLFAAGMPVAGNPSRCSSENVSQTPVYTVMGTADRIMNVETTSGFIKELIQSGGDCRLDIENGWTHETTCIQSYTAPRLDWVFSHSLDSSGIKETLTDNAEIKSITFFSLDGKILPDDNIIKGFYIERILLTDGSVTIRKLHK